MPEQSAEFSDSDFSQRLLRVQRCVQAMLDGVGPTDQTILFHCQVRAAGMACGAFAYNDENGVTNFPQAISEPDSTEREDNVCLSPNGLALDYPTTG